MMRPVGSVLKIASKLMYFHPFFQISQLLITDFSQNQCYVLVHELLEAHPRTTIIFKILLIIEFIQLLWYSVHYNLTFLWTNPIPEYFRHIIKYFQVIMIASNSPNLSLLSLMHYSIRETKQCLLRFSMLYLEQNSSLY